MFQKGGPSTLTPEVPRRKHRKGLSSSGHDLNTLGQQKYDRDALAFNHFSGFLKQPLRRHLSSDITYLVPSMPIQGNGTEVNNQRSQLVNQPTVTQYDRPPMGKGQEPIYSAPRRQRSFRKQRSLDNPTNDNQLIKSLNPSNSGPNDTINPMGYLSVASSVPHLPQKMNQSPSPVQSQLVQQRPLGYPLKPISVSTEGLIQHIISQQSQIERLSKQQDFLTQQLLISRDDTGSKRSGRSRARSRSTSSKTHNDSLTSLEPVKQRSSSREKIQEQLHAQQARVQKHIQQLEAQLELIRDIRTASSTRPTSRSHSRAPSMRDGSSCPPEDENTDRSKRPLSADPKWFESVGSPSSQLDDESKQLRSTTVSTVLPTIKTPKSVDKGTINSPDQQSTSKPRLILTNPSEESKDDETSIAGSGLEFNQSSNKLIVNRPTLIDQDDGIPFMDDELIDDPPDGDESDELETVFEFDQSESKKLDYQEGEEIDEEFDEWEDDDELDYYTRDVASPQAESDPWSRLMEEDILKAREEMDRQRSLMERQGMDLSDQRQQLITMGNDELIALVPSQSNQQLKPKNEKKTSNDSMRYSPQMANHQVGQSINQIPLTQSRSRSSSPFVIIQQQQQPLTSSTNNYPNQVGITQTNIFNFNETDTKQFQSQLEPSNSINQQQQQRMSPNLNQSRRLSPNPMINQQIPTTSGSSFSPVINSRLRGGIEVGVGGAIGPPKVIDRQISTPVSTITNQMNSPNTNYIKRPSIEDQSSENFIQSSMLRSKMLIPSPINLASNSLINQPSVPPRRKPVTPRSRSPIQGPSNVTSPSYRIQTNKNRMAGQQIITPVRRPQRSTSQTDQQMVRTNNQQSNNQRSFSPMMRSNNLSTTMNQTNLIVNQQSNQLLQPFISPLNGQSTPRMYSPKQTTAPTSSNIKPPTINRPESMFRPITRNQLKPNATAAPIIRIDPARSTSNLNLSSDSPSFNKSNEPRRSPSPQPQQSSSTSSFLKRAGSFIQRNTNFMNKNQSKNQDHNQQKNHQQQLLRRSPSPAPIPTPNIPISSQLSPITNLMSNNQLGATLKVDLQSIRSNRSSRASSPAPLPTRDPPLPTRKIFINKDTVEAGSFTDHFNHYYAKQSEPNRRPLSQQFTHSSTGELNKIRSITPMREAGHSGKHSMDSSSLKRTPSNHSNHKTINQSTANALIDAPIHYERRQTLPEITKVIGVEDKTTAKEEAILRNLAGKKKHSLPQDDLHEVPLIPGWEREKVATLAHEAREARMNQPTGPVVHLTAVTNWLIKFKFIGLIIFFNAILLYLFMRILQPIDINEKDDQS